MTEQMKTKGKQGSFIMQAGILAAAGIICRIIGLLYRSPLTAIIGDEGNGYYTKAYNIYTIILLISSYSIPAAISKVIAQKLALKEYRNAHRVFICSVWYVVVVGGLASLLVFFFGELFVSGAAVMVLKVFAPTIFFSGLLGVLRGYFQAHRTMLQTSVSQILEQILNAVISILAAYLFISVMLGNMDVYSVPAEEVLSQTQSAWNTKHALYGAAGSAVGTGAGVIVALLFMYAMYLLNRKTIFKRIDRDQTGHLDSYQSIFKLVISVVTPFILSTAIYNLSTALNQTIYTTIMEMMKGMEDAQVSTLYGIYGGKAVVISNIPIALASAMSSAVLPNLASLFAKKELKTAREKVSEAIRTTMLISIPAAVGIGVLAKPITKLLFNQKSSLDMASNLLTVLAVSVVFYSLSTLTNAVLQGIGRINKPVVNAAVALIIQTAVLVPILLFTDWNLYGLVIANIVYSGVMCLLNGSAVKKHLKYKQEFFRTFLVPTLAAAFMGAAAFGTYYGLYYLLPINIVCIAVSVFVAAIFYFVLIIKMGGITETELKHLPKGTMLVHIAKKVKLL